MRAFAAIVVAWALGSLIGLTAKPAAAQGSTWSMDASYSAETPSYGFQQPSLPLSPRTPSIDHSSTYAEGVLRGQSAVIEAIGVRNVLDAQARNLNEEAKTRAMRNKVILTETFLQKKQLLEEAFRDRVLRKWEWLEKAREHRELRVHSVHLTAYRLPASQLDRETGEVHWPAALLAAEFAPQREAIEAHLLRLVTNGPDYAVYAGAEACNEVKRLRDAYKRHATRGETNWDEYFACHRFLVGLGLEAKFWGGAERVLAAQWSIQTQRDLAVVASR